MLCYSLRFKETDAVPFLAPMSPHGHHSALALTLPTAINVGAQQPTFHRVHACLFVNFALCCAMPPSMHAQPRGRSSKM